MAWEDEITSGQISYIEGLMMDLSLWDKREEWFMDLVKKRCLSDFNRMDASTVITECKRMKRDKKDREMNRVFDFVDSDLGEDDYFTLCDDGDI